MEENEENFIDKRDNFIKLKIIQENITVLDLSYKNINITDMNTQLPKNLSELILSHNDLTNVPATLLNLEKIKILDISFNKIEYFDDTPSFYMTIEKLNISNNNLMSPPYWIWAKNCKKFIEINLSCNIHITNSFTNGYFEELLQYSTLITHIIIYNCCLNDYIELLSTFPKARVLKAGVPELSNIRHTNSIEEVPCKGLDRLCDIEILELSNTNIDNIESNIIIFKNLREINLSHNKLTSLPEEFCCLEHLEVCILSYNHLFDLPESFNKLQKLRSLYINSNSLYMLPENLCKILYLKKLDLYDNYLYEVPDDIGNLLEIDLAQNYLTEPTTEEYLQKRDKIRANIPERYDGRKIKVTKPESEDSYNATDDEELLTFMNNEQEVKERPLSSPEDWDSDDYWVPHFTHQTNTSQSAWLYFIKQKMEEGNFCPIDAHPVPIADQVNYEKLCNPKVEYESDGQFDDYSGDDS